MSRASDDDRAEILHRIHVALTDRPRSVPVPRDYRGRNSSRGTDALLELFTTRVEDYRASVVRADVDGVAHAVAERLHRRAAARIVVPAGFPAAWVPEGTDVLTEPVEVPALDTVDGVLTTCAVAIAETGTVVLDAGAGMGPRALSLVPDYHLVVVRAAQVVAGVPDAIAELDPLRPLTWISGPSATSDIELDRVEGVHGPRTLDIVLCGISSAAGPAR